MKRSEFQKFDETVRKLISVWHNEIKGWLARDLEF